MKYSHALAVFVFYTLVTSQTHASMCDNLQTTTQNRKKISSLSCESALQKTGGLAMFRGNNSQSPSCLQIQRELLLGADVSPEVMCSCPAGFTDPLFSTGDFDMGRGVLKKNDIRHLSCAKACPRAYKSALSVADPNMCACHNSEGCIFSPRNFFRRQFFDDGNALADKHVIIIPDDVRRPHQTIPCFQTCAQVVNPWHVGQCALLGVQYEFCEEISQGAPCPGGHYKDLSDGTCKLCQGCPRGTETASPCTQNAPPACKQCEEGFFSESGERCQPCRPGEESSPLRDHCVKSVESRPLTYSGGDTLCAGGEIWIQTTKTCSPCPRNTAQVAGECEACTEGYYTPGQKSTACVPCPASHTRVYGQLSCQQCPDGKFSRPGNTQCSLCPPNTIRIAGMADCVPCQSDFFSLDRVQCLPCPFDGQTHNRESPTCAFCGRGLHFDAASRQCVPCVKSANLICPNGLVQQDCSQYASENATMPCKCNACEVPIPCPNGFKRVSGNCQSTFDRESSFERFDPMNITDQNLMPCYKFIENQPPMTPDILSGKFRLRQSNACELSDQTMRLNQTVLIKHISDEYIKHETIHECSFCCVKEHVFKADLRLGLYECINSTESAEFFIS